MARGHPFFFGAGGFTLTELVVVIAIVAIISVFAAARFTRGGFDTRSVYDQLLAQASYGRKTAIAQRRAVFVQIGAAQSTLCYTVGSPCGNPVPGPTGASFVVAYGTVTVSAVTFQFDSLGRAINAASCVNPGDKFNVTVTGDGTFTFTVECETGYVHP